MDYSQINVPDLMSVQDLMKVLGIGRTKAYELIREGKIGSVKIGRSIRIPKPIFVDYIANLCYNTNR